MKLKLLPEWVEPEKEKIELSEEDYRKIERLSFLALKTGRDGYCYNNLINNFKSDEPVLDMDDVEALTQSFELFDEMVELFHDKDTSKKFIAKELEFYAYQRRTLGISKEDMINGTLFALEVHMINELHKRYPSVKKICVADVKPKLWFGH